MPSATIGAAGSPCALGSGGNPAHADADQGMLRLMEEVALRLDVRPSRLVKAAATDS